MVLDRAKLRKFEIKGNGLLGGLSMGRKEFNQLLIPLFADGIFSGMGDCVSSPQILLNG
jgi:hypothetical protein